MNTRSVWFTSKLVRCFQTLNCWDHSCWLGCIFIVTGLHLVFLRTAFCFEDLAQGVQQQFATAENSQACYSAGCCGSPWEAEGRWCRLLALSMLTQACCWIGALICHSGMFCEHKILFKNTKPTNQIPLGLRQIQIAGVNYPELDKSKHFLKWHKMLEEREKCLVFKKWELVLRLADNRLRLSRAWSQAASQTPCSLPASRLPFLLIGMCLGAVPPFLLP